MNIDLVFQIFARSDSLKRIIRIKDIIFKITCRGKNG